VGKTWGTYIANGIAIAVLYGLAYLALRYISFNQWFLPAGLRAACLLFLPYRYWPFIISGEIGITLSQKIEMIDYYGKPWVYGSSILLAPATAFAPLYVRKKLVSMDSIAHRISMATFVIALWTSIVKTLLNHLLDGPKQPENLKTFVAYLIGDYLGILTILILVLLVYFYWRDRIIPNRFAHHTTASAVLIGALYAIIEYSLAGNDLLKLTLLTSMTTPDVLSRLERGRGRVAAGKRWHCTNHDLYRHQGFT
jgi:hypothetical protein